MSPKSMALAASLVLPLALSGCGGSPDSVTSRWQAHVEHLASDEMRGRFTGTPEHRRAAEYVAREMDEIGLEQGGSEGLGYLQPVMFVSRRVREPECSVQLVFRDRVDTLVFGEDITLSMSGESAPELDVPLEFIGYGLSAPDAGHDDLAGRDLRGKIVVYLQGAPASIPEPRRSHAQSSAERWARLREAGAIGVVAIPNPRNSDTPWRRGATQRFRPGMGLADSLLDERAGLQLSVSANPENAEAWFSETPHRFADLLALADSERVLPRFPLSARIRSRVRFDRDVVESHNVVGMLRGSDSALQNEFVVLTAHLDHLGVGAPVAGDSIYNGWMDNATGVATLLEVARRLASADPRPKRTVVFVLVTGEERGLLGSYFYARKPTVPKDAIVANLNVDMVLPIVPFTQTVLHGVDESDFGDRGRRIAEQLGIRILEDPEPQRVTFVRSDQYSFVRMGVPALSPAAAAPRGTPEFETIRAWRQSHYHQPSDGPGQEIDAEAPEKLIEFITLLTRDVADAPEPPRWKETSFFKRFAVTSAAAR